MLKLEVRLGTRFWKMGIQNPRLKPNFGNLAEPSRAKKIPRFQLPADTRAAGVRFRVRANRSAQLRAGHRHF